MATLDVCYFSISVLFFTGTWSLPVNLSSPATSGPFTGYQLLQVHLDDTGSMGPFLRTLESAYQIDVWGRPTKQSFDVMVSPEQMNGVVRFIEDNHATYHVKASDVQRLLDDHMDEEYQQHRRERRSVSIASVTRRYLKFRQMRQFLQNVRDNATNADVTLSSLGRTYEGRITPYVKIRERNSRGTDKQVVVIEAGIHAREWIAPAMALNIIYRLAINPNDDPDINDLLEKFDWIIIPVVNPDGYVYSHRNSSTRLWRKTRTTLYSSNPYCVGVDGNRNFGFEWSDDPYRGASSNPCNDNYSGPQGFSEPETRNVKSLLTRLSGRVALFLSMHSYGQFFLYPWGYDASATLDDESDMVEVGQLFAQVMSNRDRWYEIGASAKVLYVSTGASDDYARGGAGIKYSFTVELSPTDTSPHGFLLPARHISTVVDDHWPAFKAIASAVWEKINQTSADSSSNDEAGDSDDRDGNPKQRQVAEDNVAMGLTEVSIDGHVFHLDLSDPYMHQWMQHYMEYLSYRRHYQGRRVRR